MENPPKSEDEIRVRPARDEDGEALMLIHREAILVTSASDYSEEERLSLATGLRADRYAQDMHDGQVIDVAVTRAADVPLAFCARKDTGVVGLFVHPDHQRKGIGSLLLGVAELALAEDGARLLTVDAAVPAVEFYEKHGYEPVEERRHRARGGLDVTIVRMTKTLA